MKSNLQLLNDCDQFTAGSDTSCLYHFQFDGLEQSLGYMLPAIVNTFQWTKSFDVDHCGKRVAVHGRDNKEKEDNIKALIFQEKERDAFEAFRRWSEELFAIWGPDRVPLASIPRLAAPLFGIVTYGVQLLAHQRNTMGEVLVWVARRAQTKRTYPGMLDSTVGGSLTAGEAPFECLVREAAEEAALPEDLIRSHAKACGTVNYICRTDERVEGEAGLLRPEVQYCYDMELPSDVKPVPADNEAEEFILMSIRGIQHALGNGEFTPANGCIMLDFLIRHGILTPENEKDYIEITARLHRPLPFPTA